MNLETELRDTLERLADEVKPANLAAAALRRAERRRVRRVGLTALAAVVGAFAVVVPTVEGLRPDARPPVGPTPATSVPAPPERTPTPGPAFFDLGPIELPGGWMLGAAPGEDGGFWVWDRTRQTYRQVPYQHVYPAPIGDYAVVVAAGGRRAGVLDLRRDSVRWLDGLVPWLTPQWTADGTRFLTRGQTGSTHVLVVTARSGTIHEVPATGARPDPEAARALWMPGDREIAVAVGGGTWELRTPSTGARVRTLENLPGMDARTDFSPDGRWVVGTGGGRTVLREVSTGSVGAALPDVHPGRAYWADNDRLLLLGGQNKEVTVVDRNGNPVGRYPLPAVMDVDEEHNYSLIRM